MPMIELTEYQTGSKFHASVAHILRVDEDDCAGDNGETLTAIYLGSYAEENSDGLIYVTDREEDVLRRMGEAERPPFIVGALASFGQGLGWAGALFVFIWAMRWFPGVG